MIDIEQQARKEAEEKYPLGADSGYAYMDEWARDHIKSLRVGYAAALITERSRPSLMVGFSEEEIERILEEERRNITPLSSAVTGDPLEGDEDEKAIMREEYLMGYEEALRYANTRSVSIDKLMEVVESHAKQWIGSADKEAFDADLRQRLEKLTQQQVQ